MSVLEAPEQVSKAARSEDQIDVHTRLPLLEAKQEKNQPEVNTVPRNLLEVFSVRFVEFKQHDLEKMFGCILINACPPYVIFSRKYGDPLHIDDEGFVKLRGPDVVIIPSDYIDILPHLFRYQACADQFEHNKHGHMWHIFDKSYDTFLSTRVLSQFGPIEVNYAVYMRGIEASVDVTLIGCQLSSATVYGWIIAQNSKLHEKGSSFLFNRDKSEGISIDVSPCKDRIAQLPLARRKTVHPIDSSLTIYVSIWQKSVTGGQYQPIAEEKKLEFAPKLGDQQVRTIRGTACQVNVVVTWPEDPEYRTGQRFYA